MSHIANVAAALKQEIANCGGFESACKQAEAIYNGVYRYPCKTIAETAEEEGYAVEGLIQEVKETVRDRIGSVMFESTLECPVNWSELDEWESEQLYYDKMDYLRANPVDLPVIEATTKVGYLCNYKGEDDGLGWALESENFKTFHGKYNYS